ncbi:MAG TPA: hypothetical protein VLB90_02915 [Pseudomonadales bacterium]|nr:hypothetical protein [Pseudomonadales bacterium]
MKNKTASLLSIALTVLLFVAAPFGLILFADPFQIYHKSFFEKAGYSKMQVYQHAGWINRLLADPGQGYQSIVVGSSVMANYTQALFDEKFPQWGKCLNLSINGSVPKVQEPIAKYALSRNPGIKKVLWDIHYFYALDIKDNQQFPQYLYNETVMDDVGYFNITNLLTSVEFLKGKFDGFSYGIEDNGPWYDVLFNSGRFDVYKTVESREERLPALKAAPLLALKNPGKITDFQYPEVELHLLNIVMPMCNTDTEFYIMFSPTTRYFYASAADWRYIYSQLYMRRYILERTGACKNVKVFAFDDVDWIVADLTNYADNFHYKTAVNAYIVDSIAADKHRLTPDNIEQYEKNFITAVDGYRKQFEDELAAMKKGPVKKPAKR